MMVSLFCSYAMVTFSFSYLSFLQQRNKQMYRVFNFSLIIYLMSIKYFNPHTKKKIKLAMNITINRINYPVASNEKSLSGLKSEEVLDLLEIKNSPQYMVTTEVAKDKSSISFKVLAMKGLLMLFIYMKTTNIMSITKAWTITPILFMKMETKMQNIFLYMIMISH